MRCRNQRWITQHELGINMNIYQHVLSVSQIMYKKLGSFTDSFTGHTGRISTSVNMHIYNKKYADLSAFG